MLIVFRYQDLEIQMSPVEIIFTSPYRRDCEDKGLCGWESKMIDVIVDHTFFEHYFTSMWDLPQKIPCMYCYSPCPQPCSRPPPIHAFTGDSWTLTGKTPVGSLSLSPGSWCTRFCCALQESISQYYLSSCNSMVGLLVTSSKRTYAIPTPKTLVPTADHCQSIPIARRPGMWIQVGFRKHHYKQS